MLRIADQHDERRKAEPGADPGVFGRDRGLALRAPDAKQLYEWTKRTLCDQEYASLGREGKGLVRRYIAKITGRSRAQVTRMIRQYPDRGNHSGRAGPWEAF